MRHLPRRHQRDGLRRVTAHGGIECGARGRHIVQHAQHAVRFDRARRGLHVGAGGVAERAECRVGLGHLRRFGRDDDRGGGIHGIQNATQCGGARAGADEHVLEADGRTAFGDDVIAHPTRTLHVRLGERGHGVGFTGHAQRAGAVLRQFGHERRDRRLVRERQREVGLQHEHLRDHVQLQQAARQQRRDVGRRPDDCRRRIGEQTRATRGRGHGDQNGGGITCGKHGLCDSQRRIGIRNQHEQMHTRLTGRNAIECGLHEGDHRRHGRWRGEDHLLVAGDLGSCGGNCISLGHEGLVVAGNADAGGRWRRAGMEPGCQTTNVDHGV